MNRKKTGTEECVVRHLKTLVDSFNQNVLNSPTVRRLKLLLVTHNIMKRNFFNWFGRPAKPPVLLEKIDQTTDQEVTLRQIHTCIKKLYRMSDYLRSQPMGLIRATMDNISEVCQQYLPEFNLLEFLLRSSALTDIPEFLSCYNTVSEQSFLHDLVWPVPTDFVPYNIVGTDKSKSLMYADRQGEKKNEENVSADDQLLENKNGDL